MNFHTMMACGVGLTSALLVLSGSKGVSYRDTASQLLREVESGMMLSEAMRRQPASFSGTYVRVIQCGEATGQLVNCLSRLSLLLQRQSETRRRLLSALIYPCFLLGSSMAMIVVMVYGFFPMVLQVTTDAGVEPPALTRILVEVSRPRYLLLLLLAGAGLGMAGWKAWHSPRFGPRLRGFAEQHTPIGVFWVQLQMVRSIRQLATLLDSGLDLVKSLEYAGRVGEQSVLLRQALSDILARVRFGQTLASSIGRHEVFPRTLSAMVEVSEEVGSAQTLMHRFCDMVEEQLNDRLELMTSLLEPILLTALGLVVATLIVAAFLPINNLVNL